MKIALVAFAALVSVAIPLLAVTSSASALTMAQCAVKYKAAKAAGTLNGQKWNDFRKAECGEDAADDHISFSGNNVLESCRRLAMFKTMSADEAFSVGDCAGMTRTLAVIGRYLPPNVSFCLPDAVTIQQAGKVFVAFLDAHPERLHELSTDLAMEAFRAAWPCAPAAKQ